MIASACEQVTFEKGAENGVLGTKKPSLTGVRTVRK